MRRMASADGLASLSPRIGCRVTTVSIGLLRCARKVSTAVASRPALTASSRLFSGVPVEELLTTRSLRCVPSSVPFGGSRTSFEFRSC